MSACCPRATGISRIRTEYEFRPPGSGSCSPAWRGNDVLRRRQGGKEARRRCAPLAAPRHPDVDVDAHAAPRILQMNPPRERLPPRRLLARAGWPSRTSRATPTGTSGGKRLDRIIRRRPFLPKRSHRVPEVQVGDQVIAARLREVDRAWLRLKLASSTSSFVFTPYSYPFSARPRRRSACRRCRRSPDDLPASGRRSSRPDCRRSVEELASSMRSVAWSLLAWATGPGAQAVEQRPRCVQPRGPDLAVGVEPPRLASIQPRSAWTSSRGMVPLRDRHSSSVIPIRWRMSDNSGRFSTAVARPSVFPVGGDSRREVPRTSTGRPSAKQEPSRSGGKEVVLRAHDHGFAFSRPTFATRTS